MSTENKDDGGDRLGRSGMAILLEHAAREIDYKVSGEGRFRDAERDRVRAQWMTALASISNAYARLEKDRELAELDARLEQLERRASTARSPRPIETEAD